MHTLVALRERGRLATLFHCVLRQAHGQAGWRAAREPDRRTVRLWQQFVLGIVVARSTRLLRVGHALLGVGAPGGAERQGGGDGTGVLP